MRVYISSIITAMQAAVYRYINMVRKPKYLHESIIHTEDQYCCPSFAEVPGFSKMNLYVYASV